MPLFNLYADNNYTESQSYAGARNQVPHIALIGGTTVTDVKAAAPGVTQVLSDYFLRPNCQILDIGVIYTTASGAQTLPGLLSFWVIPAGSIVPAQPTTPNMVGYQIPIVANTPINTILWYSMAIPQVVNNPYPTPTFASLQGGLLYPQILQGSQLRLLVDQAGTGVGAQLVRFAVRYRERDPGPPAPLTPSIVPINFPNP